MGGDGVITVHNDGPSLGKRIAELRRARGWTQYDLALRVGMSKRTVGEYERTGPLPGRLGPFDAVFGGELLRGTALETIPLDGMPMSTNGTSVPKAVPSAVRRFIEVLEAVPTSLDSPVGAHGKAPFDGVPADELAADQDRVTRAVEPLGLLLDEVFARLRVLERRVEELQATDRAEQLAAR